MTRQLSARPRIGLIVGVLVLASSVSIMSTDMYTPSLPDLVDWFETSPTLVKLTISLNMLAFGVAQLVHGPLSDRYGRKPVLVVSSIFVVFFSLACAMALTIEQLIIARILLGFAAAAEAVIGLAIIKDLYTEREQVKALAMLGMVIAITPAAAPIIGGYLHVAFGWQSNFYVISAMALLSLIVVARALPESTTPDRNALKLQNVLNAYRGLLGNSDFLIHCIILGIALGLIFVFVTAAPFVLIDLLAVEVHAFGYYQAAIVLAFFLGSVLAAQLADRTEAMNLLRAGVILILVGACTLCTLIFSGSLSPVLLVAAYMLITFGMGPLFAVAPSRALRSIRGQSGTASALLSGIEQMLAGLAAVAISILHDGSARPMAIVTLLLAAALLCLFLCSANEDKQQRSFL